MRPLGEFCEFKYGRALPQKNRQGGGYAVYGSNGIIGEHDAPLTAGPTIVIGRKGSVGALQYSDTACWPIDTTYFVDQTCTDVDLRWLFFMLQMLGLNTLNKHVAVPGLNRDDAYEKELLVPTFDDQKSIATVLGKANALRRQRQNTFSFTERLLQSVFIEMVGRETAPRCPRANLSDHLDFITSGGRGWAKYYSPKGARFIRSLDVQMNEISDLEMVYVDPPKNKEADRTRVETGDVLLTITGSLIGRVAPVTEVHNRAYVSQHVAILRTHGFQPEFLSWSLSAEEGQRQIQKHQTGQTKPGLNFEQIGRLTIPRPSSELEMTFCKLIEKRNNIIAKQREALAYADKLFLSLQQRAFQGKLTLNTVLLELRQDACQIIEPLAPSSTVVRESGPKLYFTVPFATEAALKLLDETVNKGEMIAWSSDYFKYRILGQQPPRFSFDDVMQKAESVFDGPPPYDEIKELILELLGQGGVEPRLHQLFDEGIADDPGRKEMVFQPA